MTVVELPRFGQAGYYSLADLPQRGSVESIAFGCGWPEFDEIFRFYPSQFVVVTGIAGSGKSTFILNVLLKLAQNNGVSSFLYVPENEAYLRDKLRKLWRNDESFDHLCETQLFVQSAVPEHYDDRPRPLEWVLQQALVAVERDKCEVVLIDPWNEIERCKDHKMLLTDYIGQCLTMLKQFCRSMNVILIMICHPTKAVNENGGRVPTLADCEHSMAWYNKCDNGLILVRERNTARVISAKVREIGAGKLGLCYFNVDPLTGIFEPVPGGAILT